MPEMLGNLPKATQFVNNRAQVEPDSRAQALKHYTILYLEEQPPKN